MARAVCGAWCTAQEGAGVCNAGVTALEGLWVLAAYRLVNSAACQISGSLCDRQLLLRQGHFWQRRLLAGEEAVLRCLDGSGA